ncbi:MAG: hypothetical protein MUE54_15615 [Anaerolineae bacterium]|jgi:predicted small lipoprotein YifL|nr:hypothetical protein [Anaerolineae bacterium]
MKRILQVVLSAMLLMMLVGCGGNAPTATPTAPASDSESQTGGTAENQNTANRPSAPAGDDFRPDPASWVANTGYPQLVEVFSYD